MSPFPLPPLTVGICFFCFLLNLRPSIINGGSNNATDCAVPCMSGKVVCSPATSEGEVKLRRSPFLSHRLRRPHQQLITGIRLPSSRSGTVRSRSGSSRPITRPGLTVYILVLGIASLAVGEQYEQSLVWAVADVTASWADAPAFFTLITNGGRSMAGCA